MKTSSTRRSLIALARRILHSYFASSSLDLLLAYLAPDVVWLGAGREMSAEGRQRVGDIFRASANRLISCVMSQETYRAKELTEDLWLVEGSCQLRADSSYKVYLQEYQRCTFIFTVKKRLSQLYHRFDVTNRTSLIHKFKGKA